jgi:hypothetical protein
MKKIILVFICIAFITSCNTYSVVIEPNSNTYGIACPHPTYLGTMSKSAKLTVPETTLPISLESKNSSISYYKQESISLFTLLDDARAKYGFEATIQNVRWDMKNKKRISVVYDVIKCN